MSAGKESGVKGPLADRMRPSGLDEFLGQEDILGKGKPLHKAITEDNIHSMIFWGPPGSGKTTLAKIIAGRTGARFVSLSAVMSGVKELREVMEGARERRRMGGETILFIDEIHRFNKGQQDAFLPYVEEGDVTLIGATTENPSFRLNSALISRCRVYTLKQLSDDDIGTIIDRALKEKKGLGEPGPDIDPEARKFIVSFSSGDARIALNLLEVSASLLTKDVDLIDLDTVREAAQSRAVLYDKDGEEHYNLISAFHKSLRNSDPDAALYWMARMLEGGEDPLYITRRMIRFASEDIGLARPEALTQALAADRAVKTIGLPECDVNMAQAALFLATSPKSNAVYSALGEAKKDIRRLKNEPVPLHLRNAPTDLMKRLDYGRGYVYAHDTEEGVAAMDCLPENLRGKKYYRPRDKGFEKRIRERLKKWESYKRSLRRKAGKD